MQDVLDQDGLKKPPLNESDESLGDDLLIGAEAIARELKWKTADGRWNRRRVYYLAEQGHFPIHRVKGLGICARRSALREFFTRLDAPILAQSLLWGGQDK